jgi:hypothetical protein
MSGFPHSGDVGGVRGRRVDGVALDGGRGVAECFGDDGYPRLAGRLPCPTASSSVSGRETATHILPRGMSPPQPLYRELLGRWTGLSKALPGIRHLAVWLVVAEGWWTQT